MLYFLPIVSQSPSVHNLCVISIAEAPIVIPLRVEKLAFETSLAFHLTHCAFYKQSVIPFDDANTKALCQSTFF